MHTSAYLCADSTALSEQHNLKPQLLLTIEAIIEQGNDDVTNPLQDVLPTKKVRHSLCKEYV